MRNSKRASKRSRRLTASGELTRRFLDRLAELVGCPEQRVLVELWRNWPLVMGEGIAAISLPLGHRDHRLEVGCEDSMAMQELSYLRAELLERANSFMESQYFSDVKITLVLDRQALWQPDAADTTSPEPVPFEGTCLGTYLDEMDPDSPIARCYRSFCVRRKEQAGGTDRGENRKEDANGCVSGSGKTPA